MSIKSILRAVGGFLSGHMGDAAANHMERLADEMREENGIARLKGRRDWGLAGPRTQLDPNYYRGDDPHEPYPADPLPIDPAPAVAPWDRRTPLGSPLSNVWPPHDDPYAKPEPCTVVQDPGLSTIRDYAARTNENSRRLAERGLAGRPMDSVKSVTDLLQLIERQEAAERELIHRGMEWDPVTRRWIDPDTQP